MPRHIGELNSLDAYCYSIRVAINPVHNPEYKLEKMMKTTVRSQGDDSSTGFFSRLLYGSATKIPKESFQEFRTGCKRTFYEGLVAKIYYDLFVPFPDIVRLKILRIPFVA